MSENEVSRGRRLQVRVHNITFLRWKLFTLVFCDTVVILNVYFLYDFLSVQRKLQTFRQEVYWASTLQGSVPRSFGFSAAVRRNAHLRTRFHSLKSRFKSSIVKAGVKKKHLKRRRKSELSVSGLSDHGQRRKTKYEASPQTIDCDSHDDIDDIFSSIGLWHLGIKHIQGNKSLCPAVLRIYIDTYFSYLKRKWMILDLMSSAKQQFKTHRKSFVLLTSSGLKLRVSCTSDYPKQHSRDVYWLVLLSGLKLMLVVCKRVG